MLLEAVYHRPKQNWAYAYNGNTIHLRVRTGRGDVRRAEAIVGDKYAWKETVAAVPMRLFASDERFDYWETAVIPPFRRLRYAFRLVGREDSLLLTEQGFAASLPEDPNTFFDFPYINPADVFEPPAWVKDAVFYQIFPERFASGDPSLNPPNVEPWGGKPTPYNFFGGDLQGVIDHLDHLSELGVNAIYFNPLFEATTNHKYDTKDYLKVDPHFGTNEKLKELVDLCHARGIRVMLDAVFNHSGRTFPPFVDAQKNGPASKYADWFHVREWPLAVVDGVPTYETFAFEPLMPKLNTEHPEVKAYLLEVARYWIREIGIDGWRLDVANEVDHQFWREFRAAVKAVNPEAYILGEIWHDSMMWLQGDQFDAVMNYPVTNAALDFFAREKLDAASFAHAIGAQLAAYPQQVTETAFNLLGSHDTQRLLTLCGDNTDKLKLATLFQLTYPGAPCIYYGDEVGLNGGHDPDCRKCMVWEPELQHAELLAFYRDAIALRRRWAALRGAGFAFIHAGGEGRSGGSGGEGALAYERTADGERLLIALNARAEEAELLLNLALAPLAAYGAAYEIAFAGFASPAENEKADGDAPSSVDAAELAGQAQAAQSEGALALAGAAPAPAAASSTAGEAGHIAGAEASGPAVGPGPVRAETSGFAGTEAAGISRWTVVFSGSAALEEGRILESNDAGQLKLSLGGYSFVVLRQDKSAI